MFDKDNINNDNNNNNFGDRHILRTLPVSYEKTCLLIAAEQSCISMIIQSFYFNNANINFDYNNSNFGYVNSIINFYSDNYIIYFDYNNVNFDKDVK